MDTTRKNQETAAGTQEPDPRLSLLIEQQRRRGALALSRTRLILGALILTIAAGLAAYVVFPLLREYFDGRRLTLLDSRTAALTISAELDSQRTELRADLVDRLRWVAHEVEAGWIEPSTFAQAVALDDRHLLIHAIWHVDIPRTRLFVYDMATGRGAPLDGVWSDHEDDRISVLIEMVPVGDGTMLLLGSDGVMRHYDPVSGTAPLVEPLPERYTGFRDAVAISPTEMLILGSDGTLLVYTHNGRTNGYLGPLDGGLDVESGFTSAVRLGEQEVLLTAEDAELYLLTTEWEQHQVSRVDLPDLAFDGHFVHSTPLEGDRVLVFGQVPDARWGEQSWRIFLLDRGVGLLEELTGTAFSDRRTINPGVPGRLGGGNASTQGQLIRYEVDGEPLPVWLPSTQGILDYASAFSNYAAPAVLDAEALPVIVAPDFSTPEVPLLNVDPISGEATPLPGDWVDQTEYGFALGAADGTRILLGEWGWFYDMQVNIARYDPVAEAVLPVEGGWSDAISDLHAAIALDDRNFLLFGRESIVALTDGFAMRLEAESPVAGDATMASREEMISPAIRSSAPVERILAALARDIGLQEFVNDLPDDIRITDDMISLAAALSDIIGQRIAVLETLTTSEQDLLDIPTGIFGLNQRRMEFRDFMGICRGQTEGAASVSLVGDGIADDPDEVTLACAAAWQAHLNGRQSSWWQAVATQVPPAILLLFLLATLGGLYRYNMQLSGFYHSRADALELLSMNRSTEDIEKLGRIAESLAADQIEFKAHDIPSAQAASILGNLVSRG